MEAAMQDQPRAISERRLRRHSRKSILSLLLLCAVFKLNLTAVCGFFIDERQSPSTQHWSYQGQEAWRAQYRQCGAKAQSPIDIQRRHVIQNNQLRLHFYNYNQPTKFKIQNSHHTIKLNPLESFAASQQQHHRQHDQFGLKLQPNEDAFMNSSDIITADEDADIEFEHAKRQDSQSSSSSTNTAQTGNRLSFDSAAQLDNNNLGNDFADNQTPQQAHNSNLPAYNGAPTIKLDWLDDGNNEYRLQDIHFHWGERRDNGSEHAIDGRRAAMEMHLVHIKNGLEKSKVGFTSDSVTVIAVLIESYRKSNADFNPIVNALTRINMTEQPQELEYKSINDMLPNTLSSFYTYSGSLTTPPCYQVVNWIVMSDRIYLNAKQIEMFRNLFAPISADSESSSSNHGADQAEELAGRSEPILIVPNIRQIQPLNNRTIQASFAPLSRLEQLEVGSSYSNAQPLHVPQILWVFAAAVMPYLVSLRSIIIQLLGAALQLSSMIFAGQKTSVGSFS